MIDSKPSPPCPSQPLPLCIWLTGLSGAGKSTLACGLQQQFTAAAQSAFILDGDQLRRGLSSDLGFSRKDRAENVRRTAEVARLLVDAGVCVIVALISPFRPERDFARSRFPPGQFLEVFVDAPLAECERRDPKGLYARARRGELPDFTGIDSEYEPPELPEVRLDTLTLSVEDCVRRTWLAIEGALRVTLTR